MHLIARLILPSTQPKDWRQLIFNFSGCSARSCGVPQGNSRPDRSLLLPAFVFSNGELTGKRIFIPRTAEEKRKST